MKNTVKKFYVHLLQWLRRSLLHWFLQVVAQKKPQAT